MPGRHPWCTTSWRTRSTPAQPMPTATALSRRGSRVARMDPAPARRRAASSSRASSGSPSPCRRSSTRRPGTERRRNSRVTPRCLRNNTKHNYLLRCLMTCATCGLAMFGRTYAARGKQPERRYYQCHGKDCILSARPAACPSRNVKAEEIEAAVWDHVAGLLASPERLVAQFDHVAVAAEAGTVRDRAADQQLRARLDRVARADKRLLDAYEAG